MSVLFSLCLESNYNSPALTSCNGLLVQGEKQQNGIQNMQ